MIESEIKRERRMDWHNVKKTQKRKATRGHRETGRE